MRTAADDGVAAVEMALISTVLLLLAFAALPLYSLARSYQRTNNFSADVLRYATSVDANAHETSAGSGVFTRRPTTTDITRFVQYSANNSTLVVTVQVCDPMTSGSSTTTNCQDLSARTPQSGDAVVVTVKQDVDLSLLGSLANGIGSLVGAGDIYPNGTVTISSTSTGREE
jgi:hypothetical protein